MLLLNLASRHRPRIVPGPRGPSTVVHGRSNFSQPSKKQVSYLMMICTATEVSGRFIWGIIAKYVELSKCAILWSVGLFGCMTWISMSSTFTQFAIGQLVSGFFLAIGAIISKFSKNFPQGLVHSAMSSNCPDKIIDSKHQIFFRTQ